MKQLLIAFAAATILFSCKSNEENAAIESAQKDSITAATIKQQVLDSIKESKSSHAKTKNTENVSNNDNSTTADNSTATDNTAATTTTAPAKKKGWSHTAKGAVVGAGAGAVTGAIVNKDHLKGAAIGTVVGAGMGAGIGAIVDHEKKKKEAKKQ